METNAASIEALGQQGQQGPVTDPFRDVGAKDFLNMMIAELQNQDPLDPMDNAQILQQIGQIREIVANDRLTDTLEGAFLAQKMTAASGMIGQWVVATDDNDNVLAAGQVDQVSMENGNAKLHVGSQVVRFEDVLRIQSEAEAGQLAALMDLVNQKVTAIADSLPGQMSQQVTGWVTRVSFALGAPKLHVSVGSPGDDLTEHTVSPGNVIEILGA
ncbi:MAG: flagellar hook assembly protein FlgD [Planctomycetota bacterium]|jgi:flagellar basal-body rod modification protein FlgD